MKLIAAVLLLLLPNTFLEPQTYPASGLKQPPLATVTEHLDKTVYHLGEDILVTLTLRAGARGAYVSKWSRIPPDDRQNPWTGRGRAISNLSGFDISLLTLDGKNAETSSHHGVADRFGPAPSPSERFNEEFVFLKPGEEETWRGSIEDAPFRPGKYQIVGAYMPAYDQVHELVGLPEAQGLLIADEVKSTPLIVTIE